MQSLREAIADARTAKRAVGHFNISTVDALWAIFHAARELQVPVIIGVAEGERDFLGVRQVAAVVRSLRDEYRFPIFLNADHTYSFERVKEAIDAGYDAVIFDGAKLSAEDNIVATKQCVDYARSVNPDIMVEAELGYIGSASRVLDAIPEDAAVDEAQLTTPEEALHFVRETGIDLFSPAIGSIHGMLRASADPDVHIKRLQEISAVLSTPLVLHGASGLRAENVAEAIAQGISVVHVNTELRVAWKQALKLELQEESEEGAPYKLLKPGVVAMKRLVMEKLKLFNNL
ncbi:MAG: hypothetical protein A2542_00670 [Parcubacteria group bacterium RIFOXYD2_FULL_52_8]|nr:MAG: hypothetical protein A2542_00670 [Parcubacteria group bacterium RIFOXYD2_FULL_52_8]